MIHFFFNNPLSGWQPWRIWKAFLNVNVRCLRSNVKCALRWSQVKTKEWQQNIPMRAGTGISFVPGNTTYKSMFVGWSIGWSHFHLYANGPYCLCPTHYYPCPTSRDRGCLVLVRLVKNAHISIKECVCPFNSAWCCVGSSNPRPRPQEWVSE